MRHFYEPAFMIDFVPGQRFISNAEPELGLGQVVELNGRILTLRFMAADTTRHYAVANAPLTRIRFDVGDIISDNTGNQCTIGGVADTKGLLTYSVTSVNANTVRLLVETELSSHISLSQPLKRLLAGQVESEGWYHLRLAALKALTFIESSPLLGLCSGRTELLPHQLYIAHTVATRPAPRVLLSDEVGLGKTIEACLILQQQLFSGLASRALILVPDSLVHQWLVELLRRFNLRFSILDNERCLGITEFGSTNPFESEQLVLCSRELFVDYPQWRKDAVAAGWDLLIVDEAHHLLAPKTTTNEKINEYASCHYQVVQQFAAVVPGLLLLTATPDQLGMQSHFGLLQILDPQRFHNFDEFVAEQAHYIKIAALLERLSEISSTTLIERQNLAKALLLFAHDTQLKTLVQQLPEVNEPTVLTLHAQSVLNALLDRQGTGRIVYRNTRKNISGFPERKLHTYALNLPTCYLNFSTDLNPENHFLHNSNWLKEDPRIQWLVELLQAQRGQKILLICSARATAQALEEFMRLSRGIRSAVFHERLTLIERDRAAAYFADTEFGAQLLVCSEIGSEGRNFQFSHHLVLFDLPRNPDLLEQRIGRLDRIGQQDIVNIHLPYFAATAQEVLLNFFSDCLQIFSQPNPVATQVCQQLQGDIQQMLQEHSNHQLVTQVLERGKHINTLLLAENAHGRDLLLELNSCRPAQAQSLLQQIRHLEQQDSPALFLKQVFASYGLDSEENSNGTWSVMPGTDMLVESFPLIPDDGLTFTLDRTLALRREELPFVNWLHPLVLQSLDMILQDNLGKCCVGTLTDKRLPENSLLLESTYRVTVSAHPNLQAKRYFPTSTLRTIVDSQKRSLGKSLSAEFLDACVEAIDKSHVMTLVSENKFTLQLMSKLCQQVAEKQLPALIAEQTNIMQQHLDDEIGRMQALQLINPQVQESEITYLQQQRASLTTAFAAARLQLETLRLLIVV